MILGIDPGVELSELHSTLLSKTSSSSSSTDICPVHIACYDIETVYDHRSRSNRIEEDTNKNVLVM